MDNYRWGQNMEQGLLAAGIGCIIAIISYIYGYSKGVTSGSSGIIEIFSETGLITFDENKEDIASSVITGKNNIKLTLYEIIIRYSAKKEKNRDKVE